MTLSWFIAFVVAPATVVAIGYVAVLLEERRDRLIQEKAEHSR